MYNFYYYYLKSTFKKLLVKFTFVITLDTVTLCSIKYNIVANSIKTLIDY